jgi:CHAD domain-containing protein
MELRRDETGTHGARRIVRHQLSDALGYLETQKLGDEQVHCARKELKKARATLRLLRDALGDSTYRRENLVLRDVARPLSEIRDGKVLLDTVEKLIRRYGAVARAIPVEEFQKALRRDRLRSRRALTEAASKPIRIALRQVQERSARWRVGDAGWRVIGSGLTRIYGKGREGLEASRAKRSAENLHEWRKQVKYLWHQLQLLAPLWPALIGELADQTHQLANYLGDDHDLAVLRDKIIEHKAAFPDASSRSALLALVDRNRVELQDKAFMLGARIYEERPKEFEMRFGRYWNDWQREDRLLAS